MSMKATLGGGARKQRVYWTDAEKLDIIAKAAEIQAEKPDLAGLSLLRKALVALPANRRRTIITVGQAPWFETMLAAEVKRRLTASKPATPPTVAVGVDPATASSIFGMLRDIMAELQDQGRTIREMAAARREVGENTWQLRPHA